MAFHKKNNLEPRRLKLSLKNGIIPYDEKREQRPSSPAGPVGIDQASRLISAISKVKPGSVYPEVEE